MPSILRVDGWRWLAGHGGNLSLNVGSWLVRRSPAGFRRVRLGMVIPSPILGVRYVSIY